MKILTRTVLAVSLLGISAGAWASHHCENGKCPMKAMMDTDKDGKISDAEKKAFMDKRFDEADTNKDGQLSREEFAAMHPRGGMHHDGAMHKEGGKHRGEAMPDKE